MLNVLRVLGVLTGVLYQVGCCGVGAAPGPMDVNGVVTFPPVTVGTSSQFQVPFKDSADTDEVIEGATITGPDAAEFSVIATYPIPLPAGTEVSLTMQFAPTQVGSSSATLTLQTKNMGPSPVQLEGTGLAQ
jgi:Abnormal spindle-like microcephaly-assoc'd, ASPM-SPD-2-Hydin